MISETIYDLETTDAIKQLKDAIINGNCESNDKFRFMTACRLSTTLKRKIHEKNL